MPRTTIPIKIKTESKEIPAIGIFLMKDLLENKWILTIALWKKAINIMVEKCQQSQSQSTEYTE